MHNVRGEFDGPGSFFGALCDEEFLFYGAIVVPPSTTIVWPVM
jgi:hypothetical protein